MEEIDGIFAESKSIFDTVKVAKRMPRMHLAELVKSEKAGDLEHVEDTEV